MTLTVLKDSHLYCLENVTEVSHCNEELAITFSNHHRYNTMEEILENLPPYENLNFRFKGVDMFQYDPNKAKSYNDGETSLIVMIRDTKITMRNL